MKISILQTGGLGNQMFQYAAGIYYANHFGAELEIVKEPPERAVSFGRPRPFVLSRFSITTSAREFGSWDRLMCSVAPSKKPISVPARGLTRTHVYRQDYLEDGTFLPTLPIPKGTRRLYLQGNFQAHQYAAYCEERTRREFRYISPAEGKNSDVLERIRSTQNSVSIHVRRGDYVVRGAGPQVLPIAYYVRAMHEMETRLRHPVFFVFSDDVHFTRENLPSIGETVFVDHNDELSGHEDLRLMSNCRHHIIANSTFSWWGAWLNPRSSKIVCVPASWQNKNTKVPYPDLIPPEWTRIPNDAKGV